MIKEILNPTLYHGSKKRKNFFEGWYYKITDKDNKYSFAFILGIIKGKIKEEGHSFIQILDGVEHKSYYISFPKDDFKYIHNPFLVSINKNNFSLNEIKISHYDNNIQIVGSIIIVDLIKWPDTVINPGSMGLYNYLLFMECFSHVCCLNAGIIGKLLINNREFDFTGGKIYIEKNWGRRFPENYLWIQANNFLNKDVALTVSFGKVPLWKYHFNGFLTAFLLDNKVYKFTSINRSKVDLQVSNNNITVVFERDDYILTIETSYTKSDFLTIKGPNDGIMNREVKESIISKVRVEFIDVFKGRLLFQGISEKSGLEFMGNVMSLVRKKVYNDNSL